MAKPTGPVSSNPSGAAIAAKAQTYVLRVPYRWGGANPHGWDCSGMVNWILGHDFGMTLPLGIKGFSGKTHGPVVASYGVWSKSVRVQTPEPGDLCIWFGVGTSGHIGIATAATRMVSALNPSLGTQETPIQGSGPSGAPLSFRRITAAGGSGSSGTGCPLQLAGTAALLIGGFRTWKTLTR